MEIYSTLKLECEGHVAEMTLTRPDILNRLDDTAHIELLRVLAHLRELPDIRGVVFASTGRAFSAGGDLNEIFRLNANREDREKTRELGRRTLHAFIDFPIPIVVALQGDAMGLGATREAISLDGRCTQRRTGFCSRARNRPGGNAAGRPR